ncbi:MAG: ATP synthase subunit I [Balneolaceae bacterium]|nr:ATP synthase subunit I [Balneolaceae bacterium]
MNEILGLILVLMAGACLGYGFFYGLWWTTKQMTKSPNPYRLLFMSLILRMGLVIAGFYLLVEFGWQLMATALVGFVIVRTVVIKRWGLEAMDLNKTLERSDGV